MFRRALHRFWKSTSVRDVLCPHSGKVTGFQVYLDNSPLKIPVSTDACDANTKSQSQPLFLRPCHVGLAHLIALEWHAVPKEFDQMSSLNLPVTSVAARARDFEIGGKSFKELAILKLIPFLQADSTSFLSSLPISLVHAQEKHWIPLIHWFGKYFGTDLRTDLDTIVPHVGTGKRQPEELIRRVIERVRSLSDMNLAGLEQATLISNSLVVAFALLEKKISAIDAAKAALLEEDDQISRCGLVEGAHDVTREYISSRLSAASIAMA